MRKRLVIAWVAPEFRTKLKVESAQRGISMAEYSKQLSMDASDLETQLAVQRKKRGFRLDF